MGLGSPFESLEEPTIFLRLGLELISSRMRVRRPNIYLPLGSTNQSENTSCVKQDVDV